MYRKFPLSFSSSIKPCKSSSICHFQVLCVEQRLFQPSFPLIKLCCTICTISPKHKVLTSHQSTVCCTRYQGFISFICLLELWWRRMWGSTCHSTVCQSDWPWKHQPHKTLTGIRASDVLSCHSRLLCNISILQALPATQQEKCQKANQPQLISSYQYSIQDFSWLWMCVCIVFFSSFIMSMI